MNRAYPCLPVLVLVCCGPNSDTSESGGSTSSDATTGGSTSTSTSNPGSSSTDTPTGSGEGTSGGALTSGGGETNGSTSVGETGGESSTSGEGGESTSTGGSTGDDTTSGTTGEVDGLVLDPDTLNFFWLPINSIRAAVGGFDEASNTCVSVIFFFDGFQDAMAEHCMWDPMNFTPYVVITPDAAPPCDQWDYAGNVEVVSAVGCQQVIQDEPPVMNIDMVLEVEGAPFTGKITVKSP